MISGIRRWRRGALLSLAASGMLLLGSQAVSATEKNTITIGLPAHLTGDLATLDQPVVRGAELKAAQINAAGGVLGKKLVVKVYGTKNSAAGVASVAKRLIARDKVPVIMGFSDTDSALALGPVAEQAGIPFVTPGATSPKLPQQIGRFMFLACFGDNVQAAAGAEFLLNKLQAKSIYLLADNSTEYTNLLAGYFKRAYEHGGGEILGEGSYKGGERRLGPALAALRALGDKVAALYIAAMPDDIGVIAQDLRAAGFTVPIVGGDGYDTPLLVKTAGAAANGVYYTTHAFMSTRGTSEVQRFFKAYRKAYGHAPENAFAALGYDAMGLVADAMRRAGSTDPAKIRDALAATSRYQGVTGTIGYQGGARVPLKTVSVIGVKDRKLFLAEQALPSWVPAP